MIPAATASGVRVIDVPEWFTSISNVPAMTAFDPQNRLWIASNCDRAQVCVASWDDESESWTDEGVLGESVYFEDRPTAFVPGAGSMVVVANIQLGWDDENQTTLGTDIARFTPTSAEPDPTSTASASATPDATGSATAEPTPTATTTPSSAPTSESGSPAPTTETSPTPTQTASPTPSATQTVEPLSAPPAPHAALRIGSSALRVSWSQRWTPGLHAVVTGYQIKVERPSGSTVTRHAAASARSLKVDGLRNGSRYVVTVRAYSDAGASSWSVSRSGRPLARPAKATELRATTLSDGRTKLRWKAAKRSDAAPVAGYRVYVNGELVKTLSGRSKTNWTHRGEKHGKKYVYKVRSFNACGTSTKAAVIKKRR